MIIVRNWNSVRK